MHSSKKIVIVCDKNSRTSFGRLALDFRAALSANFEASILWLKTPKYFPDENSASPEESGEKSDSIWKRSLYSGFWTFRKPFVEHIRAAAPDILFLIRPEIGFLVPVAKRAFPGIKTVVLVHDTFAETLYPSSLKFRLIAEFYAKPSSNADAFVYNSNYSKGEAEKFYGTGDRPGIVAGLPLHARFCEASERPGDAERTSFLEAHGIKGLGKMALNISLPEPRKNIETFFKMAKARPDVAFVRVGTVNAYVQKMLDVTDAKNIFHFSNLSSDELREFYRNANLYVAPSFYEGFGMPPLEAIACDTPVVCARTTALNEIFGNVAPSVFPATDVCGYLKVLDMALEGKFEYDREKVSALLERFRIETIAHKLSAFLEKILGH